MYALKTNELLKKLAKYDFYDWEGDELYDNKCVLKAGMPKSLLSALKTDNFYNSWGYASVQNKHADPSFTNEKWAELDQCFFDWLATAREYLFPSGETIVSPNLERNWLLNEEYLPEWSKKHKQFKLDYAKYTSMLKLAEIVQDPPSLREDYRGG